MDRMSSNKKSTLRRVTASDVAKAAGVSQSTVSRVFYPGSGINPRKKEQILQVAKELGYHPNALARGLTVNRSQIIALVASGINDTFFSYILCSLVDELQKQGLQMLVFNLTAADQLDGIIEKLHQYSVDGILLTSAYINEKGVHLLNEIGKPIVMINRFIPASHVKAVSCDNADGGRQIVDHFIGLGRKRLALLSGPSTSYTGCDRSKGFCDRLKDLGIELHAHVEATNLSHMAGRAAMNELLAQSQKIDAVFCTNDILALGALDAASYDFGLKVPDDLVIAGFDGNEAGQWPCYDLTTIKQPIAELVHTAVDTLYALMDEKEVFPDCKLLKGTLTPRGSTNI